MICDLGQRFQNVGSVRFLVWSIADCMDRHTCNVVHNNGCNIQAGNSNVYDHLN